MSVISKLVGSRTKYFLQYFYVDNPMKGNMFSCLICTKIVFAFVQFYANETTEHIFESTIDCM